MAVKGVKMGSYESHFNVSLIVRDKVTRQGPQTTTFLLLLFLFSSSFFHDTIHRVKDRWFGSNDLSFKTSNDARRLMERDVSYNKPGGLPYSSHFKFEAHTHTHKKAHTQQQLSLIHI